MKRLVGYFPVLHAGLIGLIDRRAPELSSIRVMDGTLVESLGIRPEPRALPASTMATVLSDLYPALDIAVFELDGTCFEGGLVVAGDEAGRALINRYGHGDGTLEWDTIFLHWDGDSVQREALPSYDREVSEATLGDLVAAGQAEAELTSDYWRKVGVVLFSETNRQILLVAHNQHLPSEHTPYAVGDIRHFVPQGTDVCKCGAIHGEANIVSLAAKQGIATDGLSVYQTYFPCVPCAKAMAVAGIRRVYFSRGNAYLDVEQVLRGCGVEMVYVRPMEP